MRLQPPDKYDGETDFDRFSKLLRAYMGCQDRDYSDMLHHAETSQTPITQTELNVMNDNAVTRGREDGEFKVLNSRLYYVLISLTDKGAFTIVDNVEDSNGMEAWRRLCERYARTKRQKSVMSLVAIMGMKLPDDNTLENKFSQFETELDRYEKATGDELPQTAKIGILVAVTTGRLHEHLVLNMGDYTTYDQIRTVILNYTRSRRITKKPNPNDPVPMEIDGLFGKGKTKAKQFCTICQREGHWTSECATT